jgi:hypothetical protein
MTDKTRPKFTRIKMDSTDSGSTISTPILSSDESTESLIPSTPSEKPKKIKTRLKIESTPSENPKKIKTRLKIESTSSIPSKKQDLLDLLGYSDSDSSIKTLSSISSLSEPSENGSLVAQKSSTSDSIPPLSQLFKNKNTVKPVILKEKPPCPEGKIRNIKTGRCIKIKVIKEKKTRKIKKKSSSKSSKKSSSLSSKKSSSRSSKKSSSRSSKKTSRSSASWSTKASSKLSSINEFISENGDELNQEQRKEFDSIIKNLQEGKLKGMNLDLKEKGTKEKPNSKELSINCLKMFDDIALEKELEKRKREKAEKVEPTVNILVPRKKVPKA